jgi:CheY-like chemotaxis protein
MSGAKPAAHTKTNIPSVRHMHSVLPRSRSCSCVLWTDRSVDSDADVKRWRILVVDDNEASAEGLAAALAADGLDTRYVLSGVDALHAIDGWVPHVIVLDISMPEHDGFATARVLRRIPPTRNVGIIAFTASTTVSRPRASCAAFHRRATSGSSHLRRSPRITSARKACTPASTATAKKETRRANSFI